MIKYGRNPRNMGCRLVVEVSKYAVNRFGMVAHEGRTRKVDTRFPNETGGTSALRTQMIKYAEMPVCRGPTYCTPPFQADTGVEAAFM